MLKLMLTYWPVQYVVVPPVIVWVLNSLHYNLSLSPLIACLTNVLRNMELDKQGFLKNYQVPQGKSSLCCAKHKKALADHHTQVR